jgi:aspartate/methionine/tyrosine aminotransferase
MSNDMVIDLRVGEARVLRDITRTLFGLDTVSVQMKPTDWEYQPEGHEPLVKHLEDKHNARVIITNGANQGLHAAMYALKTKGYDNMGIRLPYWNRIPEIAKHIDIGWTGFEGPFFAEKKLGIDSYLLTMPNNPDGYLPTMDVLRDGSRALRELEIPLIHDAVYYTRSYLPVDHPIEAIGDVQLFSASKSYGLSSLRVGYMVVYNASFYKPLLDYMEFATVGVSVPAQKFFLHLLKREEALPIFRDNFEKLTRADIKKAKSLFKTINPDYIEFPSTYDRACGVFAWVKPKRLDVFEKANVQVLDGEIFGAPGFVRVNLAAGNGLIAEAVKRINDV